MKPKNLKLITILLCLFNSYGIIGLFFLNIASEYFKYVVIAAVIVVLVSFIVIGFFWKGKNWARILVIVASVLAIFNMYNFHLLHILSKFVIGGEFVFACYLLYWLNTKAVKEFFSS